MPGGLDTLPHASRIQLSAATAPDRSRSACCRTKPALTPNKIVEADWRPSIETQSKFVTLQGTHALIVSAFTGEIVHDSADDPS